MTEVPADSGPGLLFAPLQVGPMAVGSRIVHPPHAMAIGRLFGSPRQAARAIAYWRYKAAQGPAWVVPISATIDSPLAPGFEPTGLGAVPRGIVRHPLFVERARELDAVIRSEGSYALAQLVLSGGQPHAPSDLGLSEVVGSSTHPLDEDEIEQIVAEFAFAAGEVARAGLAGVELHACHDDLIEWFLSPRTNRRGDRYGARTAFLLEIVRSIRARTGPDFVIGVRLEVDQDIRGGYGPDDALTIARDLERTGAVTYLSWVFGGNWGEHTYMPTAELGPAPWSYLVAAIRSEVDLPMVYTGGVDAATAERVLAAGHADLVGIARAAIAEPDLVAKLRAGRSAEIRPCIGCNECLHRPLLRGQETSCSVNPDLLPVPTRRHAVGRRVLVVGGGPAGLELAARLGEEGHRVVLRERSGELGGQLLLAALARENRVLRDYVDFQLRRLRACGAGIELGVEVEAAALDLGQIDVVAVATGSRPRVPEIEGLGQPGVWQGRDVLAQGLEWDGEVVLLADDDGLAPLSVAAHLADRGARLHLLYRGRSVAPDVGRYSGGSLLARLHRRGVAFHVMQRVSRVEAGHGDGLRVHTSSVFGDHPGVIDGVCAVVLSCGATPEASLAPALRQRGVDVHVLGDAYAARDIGSAVRQAAAVAERIVRSAATS